MIPLHIPGIIERNPEKIRKTLEDILNRSEFAGLKPGPLEILWNQVLEVLKQWRIIEGLDALKKYLGNILVYVFSNPATGTIATILIFIALGFILSYLLLTIRRKIQLGTSSGRQSSDYLHENSKNPADREKLADNCAAEGNFVDAIRHLYISLLLHISSRGIMEFNQSRTNRETERIINSVGPPLLKESFNKMNSLFEEKVYALRTCTDEEYLKFREEYYLCRKGVLS